MKQSEAVVSGIGGCEAGKGGKNSGKTVARDVQAKAASFRCQRFAEPPGGEKVVEART